MANNKKVSKKKSSSSKGTNKKKKIQEENHKKIETVGDSNIDFMHIFFVASSIILIFLVFYILTVYITGRDKKETTTSSEDTTISYTDTIAGRSFSMPENEYLVLYYDQSDTDLHTDMSTLVSDYRSDPEHYALYSVDMSRGINKTYAAEESNTNPESVSDLAISGPSLIHFKEGNVMEYLEGVEDITNYLK
ncbi:MAG: hypothetical protein IKF71_05165 [Bacilli bacterium]|nr:hypothetical protein [Bacilli bacterium]